MNELIRIRFKMTNNDTYNKVGAIRAIRKMTGMDLKTAKEFVEDIARLGIVEQNVNVIANGNDLVDTALIDAANSLAIAGITMERSTRNNTREILHKLTDITIGAIRNEQLDMAKELLDIRIRYNE